MRIPFGRYPASSVSRLWGIVPNSVRLMTYAVILQRMLRDTRSPFYHAFPELGGRAVIRETFLIERSVGKKVLHFGFLDAPFTEERFRSGALLHSRLKEVARSVFGVDISADALDTYRRLTGDHDNALIDVQGAVNVSDLARGFDLVLFPEILEHLRNPGIALANLRAVSVVNAGCEVCITTPNAFFLGGFLPAVRAREIVHPEHYYYFSPATLLRLLGDSGLRNVALGFYSNQETVGAPGLTKAGLIACCRP